MAFVVLSGYLLPYGFASAQAMYSRSGAGVSRLALNVTTFNTPEFGTVTDAINLATGNMYIAMDKMGRNNDEDPANPAKTPSIAGTDWQLNQRIRLMGFNKNWTLQTANGTFGSNGPSLGFGDGSYLNFRKKQPTSTEWSYLPSWIQRYRNASGVLLYESQPQPGTQYSREWVVIVPKQGSIPAFAHYYDTSGTRYTFHNDGEYVDYIQDSHQQYRAARARDPEGRTSTYKTQLTYMSAGRLSRVSDEYGRTTTYQWSGNRLYNIYILLRDPNDNRTFARRIQLIYAYSGNRLQVSHVVFSTHDGITQGTTSSTFQKVKRTIRFYYDAQGRVIQIKRPLINNDLKHITTFTYDNKSRVTSVTRTGEPKITYDYQEYYGNISSRAAGAVNPIDPGEPVNPGNPGEPVNPAPPAPPASSSYLTRMQTVTVTQSGDNGQGSSQQKITEYNYDRDGLLRQINEYLDVAVQGINGTDTNILTTKYAYYPNGSTYAIEEPSGATQVYSYDTHGNLASTRFFESAPSQISFNYNYTTSVATMSPTAKQKQCIPVGSRVPTAAQITDLMGYFSNFAGVVPTLTTTFLRDCDGRLLAETVHPKNLSGANATTYQPRSNATAYSYYPRVVHNSQTFQAIYSTKNYPLLSGNRLPTSFQVTNVYYNSGLLAWSTTNETTHSSIGRQTLHQRYYYTGNRNLWVSWGSVDASGHGGRNVLQYRDKPHTITITDRLTKDPENNRAGQTLITNLRYDELGYVALTTETDAFVRRYTTTSPSTPIIETNPYNPSISLPTVNKNPEKGTRYHYTSRNGFGQLVWDRVSTRGKGLQSAQGYKYSASGLLIRSWDGSPHNTTLYSPDASGRIARIFSGIGRYSGLQGNNDRIMTLTRNSTIYTFDGFGRAKSVNTNGYVVNYAFDSFDRAVQETRPDGSSIQTRYSVTGEVSRTTENVRPNCAVLRDFSPNNCTNFNGLGSSGVTYTAYKYYDALGRLIRTQAADGGTMETVYDAYGKPVRIKDHRMADIGLTSGAYDTIMRYDAFGNMTNLLAPVMQKDGIGYRSDRRRPYSVMRYDAFGRVIERRVAFQGSHNINHAIADSNAAITRTSYDGRGNPIQVVDPEGYKTLSYYDASNNLVKMVREVEKGGKTVDMHYAYDSVGRQTQIIDGNRISHSKVYNLLGAVIYDKPNERVRYGYTYTVDGLLRSKLEPNVNCADLDNCRLVTTEYYNYRSNSPYPYSKRVAHHNTLASAQGGASTSYTYDRQGRILRTILPGAARIEKRYDSRGNLIYTQDDAGFETINQYDAFNRVVRESQPLRTNATQRTRDKAAFGNPAENFALVNAYTYDKMGNLTQQDNRGYITGYRYNSLGKVIQETRSQQPYLTLGNTPSSSPWDNTIRKNYDLMGNVRIEGGLGRLYTTTYIYNKRGEVTQERYRGKKVYNSLWVTLLGIAPQMDYHNITNTLDGLGRRTKRHFDGSSYVYENQRDANGISRGTAYITYWRYDNNNNLLVKWDKVGATNVNEYHYRYNNLNQETSQRYYVNINVDDWNASQNTVLANGVTLAASQGYITSTYTSRGELKETNIEHYGSKTSPPYRSSSTSHLNSTHVLGLGDKETYLHRYTYYQDGSLFNTTNGTANISHFYDLRGRIARTYDSSSVVDDKNIDTTTYYSYNGDSSIKELYEGKAKKDMLYRSHTEHTLGGLIWLSKTEDEVLKRKETWYSFAQNYYYNSYGKIVLSIATNRTSKFNLANDRIRYWHTKYRYNQYGQEISVRQSSPNERNPVPETETISREYDANGYLTTDNYKPYGIVIPVQGYVRNEVTVRYLLDSRGNRIGVHGGKYNNYIKRYNAEGKVTSFNFLKEVQSGHSKWATRHYLNFRYDPYGNQAISSESAIIDSLNSNWPTSFGLQKNVFAILSVNAKPQIVRHIEFGMKQAYSKTPCFFSDVGCWESSDHALLKHKKSLDIKDSTFTLAEGFQGNDWQILNPFNVTEGTSGLEAPEESVVDILGIAASDAVLPEEALPDLSDESSGSIEAVTPPSDTNTVATASVVETEGANEALNQQQQQVGDVDITPAGQLGDTRLTSMGRVGEITPLPNPTNSNASVATSSSLTSTANNNIGDSGLEPANTPSDIPTALQSVTASGAQAPEIAVPTLGDNIANDGVTKAHLPEDPIPTLGNTPFDGIGNISPPDSLNPPVPTLGDNPKDPITVATPALGTGNDKVEAFYDPDQGPGNHFGHNRPRPKPTNISENVEQIEASRDEETGDLETEALNLVDDIKKDLLQQFTLGNPRISLGNVREIREWLANELGISIHNVSENLDNLAAATAEIMVGNLLEMVIEANPIIQVEMLRGLQESFAIGAFDTFELIRLLDDMESAISHPVDNPISEFQKAIGTVGDTFNLSRVCSSQIVSGTVPGAPSRSLCSSDLYGSLDPNPSQTKIATLQIAIALTGSGAFLALRPDLVAGAVFYVSVNMPNLPSLTNIFNRIQNPRAYFVIGAGGNKISRHMLENLTRANGNFTTVYTNLTRFPEQGRKLFVAIGPNAQHTANHFGEMRGVGQLYVGRIPSDLLNTMINTGLARVSNLSVRGKPATEIEFLPQATEFIIRFFSQP